MPWAKTMLGFFCSNIVISSNEMTNSRYYVKCFGLATIRCRFFDRKNILYNVTCIFVDFDRIDLDYLRYCFCTLQLAHAQAGGVDSDSETPSFEDWNDASGSRFSRDGVVRADRRTRLAERGRSARRAPSVDCQPPPGRPRALNRHRNPAT